MIFLAMVIAVCLSFGVFATAYARTVTITGSNFFYANDGASIYAYREVQSEEDDDGETTEKSVDYVMFYMQDEDANVTYRYNLAYHWYERAEIQSEEESADAEEDETPSEDENTDEESAALERGDEGYENSFDYTSGVEKYFNMTIGFNPGFDENENDKAVGDFQTYTITFQSQQYAKTEDAVTTNYLTFVKTSIDSVDDDGNAVTIPAVYVITTDDKDETEKTEEDFSEDDVALPLVVVDKSGDAERITAARITIEFTNYSDGVYTVKVSSSASDEYYEGEFTNIGGTYSKRVNSTTAGVMPLTFTATFADEETEGEETGRECGMIMFQMNGQDFIYTNADSDAGESLFLNGDQIYEGTTVTDTAAPVLCVNGNLTHLTYGETLDFDYTAIDVLASSPKTTISYYVLTGEQYNSHIDYNQVEDETIDDELVETPFSLTTSDSRLLIETDTPYLPQSIIDANKTANDTDGSGYSVNCLAKVCIQLTDITSSSNNNMTTYVMLDWYVNDESLITVDKGQENEANFIQVVKDNRGLTYGYTDDEGEYHYYDEDAAKEYQEKVDELAIDDNECSLYAGSSNYFYLPEYSGFMTDNLDGYEDLSYYVYYYIDDVTGSNTSLSYNNLSISLSSEGEYKFTVFAKDSAGNDMYYLDEDGEMVTFESGDVYDDDIYDKLPWFTFKVVYNGATVDDPGEQDIGYVGTAYTDISFDINGISSYYNTSYTLYEFDLSGYLSDNEFNSLTYEDFVAQVSDLFEDPAVRPYFKTIKEYADLNEEDDDYDEMSEYEWSSSSLSFIPVSDEVYYAVKLTVEDTKYHLNPTTSFMAIHVSAETDSFYGESDWLKNNVVSVVLFCVAGVALIGIIVLFCIKPKEDEDIDEQMTKQAEKAKQKAEKKRKKA